MVLYGRRETIRRNAEAEARGEAAWGAEFSSEARVRLAAICEEEAANSLSLTVAAKALATLRADIGLEPDPSVPPTPTRRLRGLIRNRPDADIPSVLEAVHDALTPKRVRARFAASVNQILSDHMIGFEMIGGRMVPFESRTMHAEVVEPVLTLLGGNPRWSKVETAYRKALGEISVDPTDAITDASTALQEMLREIGCKGSSLRGLARDAQRRGLVAPYDSKLLDWVGADRSQRGDGHGVTDATGDDAWLSVHVAGAIILRLSKASA
jgi:hypothetical protein